MHPLSPVDRQQATGLVSAAATTTRTDVRRYQEEAAHQGVELTPDTARVIVEAEKYEEAVQAKNKAKRAAARLLRKARAPSLMYALGVVPALGVGACLWRCTPRWCILGVQPSSWSFHCCVHAEPAREPGPKTPRLSGKALQKSVTEHLCEHIGVKPDAVGKVSYSSIKQTNERNASACLHGLADFVFGDGAAFFIDALRQGVVPDPAGLVDRVRTCELHGARLSNKAGCDGAWVFGGNWEQGARCGHRSHCECADS
jgi:hypothetical protein